VPVQELEPFRQFEKCVIKPMPARVVDNNPTYSKIIWSGCDDVQNNVGTTDVIFRQCYRRSIQSRW